MGTVNSNTNSNAQTQQQQQQNQNQLQQQQQSIGEMGHSRNSSNTSQVSNEWHSRVAVKKKVVEQLRFLKNVSCGY